MRAQYMPRFAVLLNFPYTFNRAQLNPKLQVCSTMVYARVWFGGRMGHGGRADVICE